MVVKRIFIKICARGFCTQFLKKILAVRVREVEWPFNLFDFPNTLGNRLDDASLGDVGRVFRSPHFRRTAKRVNFNI